MIFLVRYICSKINKGINIGFEYIPRYHIYDSASVHLTPKLKFDGESVLSGRFHEFVDEPSPFKVVIQYRSEEAEGYIKYLFHSYLFVVLSSYPS